LAIRKFGRFGRFNYYIADCRLPIDDWKNKKLDSCWNLPLIYSRTGIQNKSNDLSNLDSGGVTYPE